MRGGPEPAPGRTTGSGMFLCTALSPLTGGGGGGDFFCRGAYVGGPSSSTQSLRSTSDVCPLRTEEADDGEFVRDFTEVTGVAGAIGK